jgi:tetratricopeptide (TPR) repeat protein
MDELGRTEEAIDFNQQGVDANPESGDLYYNLGTLYMEQSRYQEAKELFEKALEYDMEIASKNLLLSALAASYAGLGDMEARRKILMEKAIYNQISLKLKQLDYEQQKLLVQIINSTIDRATEDSSQEMDESVSR